MKIKTGDVFCKWTVIGDSHIRRGSHYYILCRCECGVEKNVDAGGLSSGASKSCGCYGKQLTIKARMKWDGHASKNSPTLGTYRSWCQAKHRCTNANNSKFAHYGGRGIKMCPEWADSFQTFLVDMGPRPDGYSLERIDVNGDYRKDNCIWIPLEDQSKNRRTNHKIDFGGRIMNLSDWAREIGLTVSQLSSRLRKRTFNQVIAELTACR